MTWVSAQEVASELGVSKMTVYRLIWAGELPAIQVGRSYRIRERVLAEKVQEWEAGR